MVGEDLVDVVVVGAGAAGLTAAQELTKRGACVVVLEAGEKVGGRVLSDKEFASRPLELGPEFLHGEKNNRLLDLVRGGIDGKPNASLEELEWPNYYYFGKEGTLMHAEDADKEEDVAKMHDSFERLSEMEPRSTDTAEGEEASLLQYFASCGLSSRVLDLADAIFANDYGADMSDVGMHEVIHEQRHWAYGEKYLVLRGACLQDAMETLARGLDVRTGWKVQRVRKISPTRVEVVGGSGTQVVHARAAVVTVPLPVLQRRELEFEPPLQTLQGEAIRALKMGSALKIVVKLGRRFWPADFFDAVCSDSFMPEVWLTPAAEVMQPDAKPPYMMVGFVAGARAERVAKLPDAEVARKMLSQLDCMFGTAERPHPASECCEGFLVKDWAVHPATYGAYTHPTRGAAGQRPKLGEPVHHSIFFAGEACHTGGNPCVHGAMETGEEAAARCWQLLEQQQRQQSSSWQRSRL